MFYCSIYLIFLLDTKTHEWDIHFQLFYDIVPLCFNVVEYCRIPEKLWNDVNINGSLLKPSKILELFRWTLELFTSQWRVDKFGYNYLFYNITQWFHFDFIVEYHNIWLLQLLSKSLYSLTFPIETCQWTEINIGKWHFFSSKNFFWKCFVIKG